METKEITPEYVLQPHPISRAGYRLSAHARKIIAMGMALLPQDLSNLTVGFSIPECCQALGLEIGGHTYKLIKAAVGACIEARITLETGRDWEMFAWISYAKCENNRITLEFSEKLAGYLRELIKMYTRLDLADIGKLQSLYAIRYYELAKSYESLAGQRGNREKSWYFERSVKELRRILGVEDERYTKTNDFKKRVIEGPLEELNSANLGLSVRPEYVRKGKFLEKVRFDCKKEVRKVQGRKKKSVTELPEPEKNLKFSQELAAKEGERLKKLYADEYARLYAGLIKTPENAFYRDTPHLWAKRVDSIVCDTLKERHGIRK